MFRCHLLGQYYTYEYITFVVTPYGQSVVCLYLEYLTRHNDQFQLNDPTRSPNIALLRNQNPLASLPHAQPMLEC